MLERWIKGIQESQKILGMNARNISYIKPYNKRKAIERVDDKIRFKRILEKNGIPTPALLGKIATYQDLREFNFENLPSSFVLKPAAGFGGEGIVVLYGEQKRKAEEERVWVRRKGDYFPESRVRNHVYNILDGSFSKTNTPDTAFFEERIQMTKFFRPLAYKGIPDIRVVVFNSTPVMAMLRLPTRQSGGAANLHAGGIGIGIDIARGITTNAIMNDHLIETLPDTGQTLSGIKLPKWDQILRVAIETAKVTNLGFTGIDIALDREKGPVVLEANARPGLAIQIANLSPLKERLEKVHGLKEPSTSRGIRIAKDLFGGEIEEEVEDITGKQVIGLTHPITLLGSDNITINIRAKVDTGADSSSIDSELVKELGYERVFEEFDALNIDMEQPYYKLNQISDEINTELKNDSSKILAKVVIVRSGNGYSIRPYIRLNVKIEEKSYTCLFSISDRSQLNYKVLLGKRDLKSFLVDPNK